MLISEPGRKESGVANAPNENCGAWVGRVDVSEPNSGTEPSSGVRDQLPVGIVAEKRRIDHPWQEFRWLPVAVVPGVAVCDGWTKTDHGDGFEHYLIGTLPIEIFRKETEAYKVNLSSERPSVYVVLRAAEDEDDPEIRAVFATVSPYEAQDFLDTGEDIVEPVPLPEGMIAWLQSFIDQHHVDEQFKKRKRKDYKEEKPKFGKVLHPIEQRFYQNRGIDLLKEGGE